MATSMGICNFFSRFTAMFAPLVAELEPPIPMVIIIIFCTASLLVSLLMKEKEKEDEFKRIK